MPSANSLYTSLAHKLYSQELPLRLIRRIHDSQSVDLTMHSHDFIELVIITEGCATHQVQLTNGTQYQCPIGKGSVFMMNIGESHQYVLAPGQRIVLENIIFDPSILKYLYIRPENDVHYLDFIYLLPQLEPAVRFSALTQLDDEELQKLIVLVQLFDSEQTVQRPVGSSVMIMLLGAIIALVYRQYIENSGVSLFDRPKVEAASVLRAVGYIQQHYSEDISLEKLTGIAMCGERHLTRKFKDITGQTITEYIREQRIVRACYLLRNTDMKINEIAAQVGFNDCSYFIRLFRQSIQRTPKEYRERED